MSEESTHESDSGPIVHEHPPSFRYNDELIHVFTVCYLFDPSAAFSWVLTIALLCVCTVCYVPTVSSPLDLGFVGTFICSVSWYWVLSFIRGKVCVFVQCITYCQPHL